MVRTQHQSSDQGTKIPQATQPKEQRKKNHNLDAPGLRPLPGGFEVLHGFRMFYFTVERFRLVLFKQAI